MKEELTTAIRSGEHIGLLYDIPRDALMGIFAEELWTDASLREIHEKDAKLTEILITAYDIANREIDIEATTCCKGRPELVREWYHHFISIINDDIIIQWKDDGSPERLIAERCWAVRRSARILSRLLLSPEVRRILEARNDRAYGGDIHGPSFEGLVTKHRERLGTEATDDQIFNAIIESSTRTNKCASCLARCCCC